MDTWSFTWALRNLVAELLMPPGIWTLLILIAVFMLKRKQALQRCIIVISTLMVWVMSTNYFAIQLSQLANQLLHWPRPLDLEILKINAQYQKQKPQAIIILGGGRRQGALDASQDNQQQDVSAASMERLRYGARLAKVSQLPVLVTGGAPDKTSSKDLSEAQLMAKVLHNELNVEVKWVEGNSSTTQENAKFSAQMLKKENIQIIYLVTHFWHMPRAKAIFENESLNVVGAPMGYYQKKNFMPLDFYPSAEGFHGTRRVFREILGNLWYRLKF